MIDSKWQDRLIQLAQLVASWSKDPSTQVGAVVFDAQRRIVGLGYNGFPRGVDDDPARYEDKLVKRKIVVHAESNAILNANKSVRECGLLVTRYPCTECAKLIIQSGITDVYAPSASVRGFWSDDARFSSSMLTEARVEIHDLTPRIGPGR